jgi:PTS system nitrogen regulatory IIA component
MISKPEFKLPTTAPAEETILLADVFPLDAIVMGLSQRNKVGAVEELIHRLVKRGRVTPESESIFVQMILAREKMGTTALGNGVAFPHCRTSQSPGFLGVIGHERNGIPFDAIDGEPVHTIFLLLGPLDQRVQLFQLLGRISAIGRDKALRLLLRGCRTAEHVYSFLQEIDSNSGENVLAEDAGRSKTR